MTTPADPVRPATPAATQPAAQHGGLRRVSSGELMDGKRELEIEHAGRIYRLRITQLNKLILTA